MLGRGLEEGSRICSSYSVSAQLQYKPQESLVETAPRASLDRCGDEDQVAVTCPLGVDCPSSGNIAAVPAWRFGMPDRMRTGLENKSSQR